MNYQGRRQRLNELMKDQKIQDFLITDLENIFYLSGFKGTNAMIWQKDSGETIFTTDPRYAGKTRDLQGMDINILGPGETEDFINQLPKNLSVESNLTLSALNRWKERAPDKDFEVQDKLIEGLRVQKEEEEIDRMRKAAAQADKVLQEVVPGLIREGMSEKKLCFQLEQALMGEGTFGLSFPAIVAFGENSAIPHHEVSERILQKGDNILIDCGTIFEGYCSDITRNFSLGEPSSEYRNKYDLLLAAQEKTLEGLQSGKSAKSVDQTCRDYLGEEEKYFTHSLGHGVGINVHEEPRVSSRNEDPILNNSVVTVEPGLYYTDKFGIRIEDLVWVREEGNEILSQTSKELIVL